MTTDSPLRVLFVWHFHQPYYGLVDTDEFLLPWVRLHGVKAYYDMGRLLEEHPDIRATFNFSGSLLRQLREMTDDEKRDRWWRLSIADPEQLTGAERRAVIRHFFSIDADRGIHPLERYRQLHRRRRHDGIDVCADQFDRRDLLDLQVLFNLAWCGFCAGDDYPIVEELRAKGRDFSVDEKRALLDVHIEILGEIIPLYRRLANRGQIEISTTPMYHPIVPLVIDTDAAKRCSPDRPRPTPYRSPGDARWHIDEALATAEEAFGIRPDGMWPSEGAVSPEAVELFADADLSWIATDEDVLRHSRRDDYRHRTDLWRPWRLGNDQPDIFFRDHHLSDKIGFVYSENPAAESADDLIDELRTIAADIDDNPGCAAIILDGENPWEHYDDDGRPFLNALYERLADADDLRTTVPSEVTVEAGRLDELHSGSWIMANYDIWIGHRQTNRAWEWLARASNHLEDIADKTPDHPGLARARHSLRIAQGSDWFWWYGDDFSSEQDDQFDALFRSLVAEVWTAVDTTVPPELHDPIAGHDISGDGDRDDFEIQPPRQFIDPDIDGRIRRYFDWTGAGHIRISGAQGSMYETFRPISHLLYGFSPRRFYLRIEPGDDFGAEAAVRIRLFRDHLVGDYSVSAQPARVQPSEGVDIAFEEVGELGVDLDTVGLSGGDEFGLVVSVQHDRLQLLRLPPRAEFRLQVPDVDPRRRQWML